MSALLDFYRGLGADAAGRSIDEIWGWDHRRLEMAHDFIQWLFPLPEASRFNPDAPLLSAADIAAFCTDVDLKARALHSLDMMLGFYGLTRGAETISRRPDFDSAAHWLQPLNHNHLRLTRILLFLRHVGLAAEAESLLALLENIAANEGATAISQRTLRFWRATRDA